jgi:acyl-coenzyme A thioesterase PaaI-like protein
MKKNSRKNQSTDFLPSYPGCFVCGKENPRGLKSRFAVDGDKVRAEFFPDASMVGYEHTVHGGIIGALLDEAIIWAIYASTGRFGVTAELTLRFVKSLPVQQKCCVEGWMVEDKGRLWIAQAKLIDDSKNLYARAGGKVVPMSEEQTKMLMSRLVYCK